MDALLLFHKIWELEKAATIAKRPNKADTVENQSIDFSSCWLWFKNADKQIEMYDDYCNQESYFAN